MMAVLRPNLIYELYIQIDFLQVIAFMPILSGVVHSEKEGHIVFIGKAEEHLHKIDRRIIHILCRKDRFERSRYPTAEAGAYQHHRVDAHILHGAEIPVPLLYSPVLVRNIPAYLIKESRIDRHALEALRSLELLVCKLASATARYRHGCNKKDRQYSVHRKLS